ncbi:MAG: hypothetical protein A2015_15470 [Spirochaetes bacterium GWF1_31_7]|nr:MAG: hypothetical protein A2Y30_11890 [Spirochaetes bacterium GWE1_32_154]OHD47265.1 MAG: hypothetical protein A2Y29_02905 [Spirochaetes bacterium GWE2_31_10]OHD52137.1 MAG: hypothetical protein A2015_15470 [Spirochaetes bacterium GWF1_31_7]HBD96321.1 hypothetical protein [Spirochaetia bacterium]
MKISVKLLVSFVIIAFFTLIIGGTGVIIINQNNKVNRFIYEKGTTGIFYFAKIVPFFYHARNNVDRFVYATTQKDREEAIKEIGFASGEADKLTKLYQKTMIDEKSRELFSIFEKSKKGYLDTVNELFGMIMKGEKRDTYIQFYTTSVKNTESIHSQDIIKIIDYNAVATGDIAEKNQRQATNAIIFLIFFTVIAFVFAVALGVYTGIYSITKPISKLVKSLTESSSQFLISSKQLSQASQDLANGASEQASSIEETSASIEELSSMVKLSADNSKESANRAGKTREESEAGYSEMKKMLQSMKGISDSADQIQSVIDVIDEIAFQTNMLALNASVEAARAGEAGMGFAVVADEVKQLANRSASSAKETAKMIKQTIDGVNEGLGISKKLSEIFEEILVNSDVVKKQTKEMEVSSAQQSEGIEQVQKAILELDSVVQNNAASSEETASTAEELENQVKKINNVISELDGLLNGLKKENKTISSDVVTDKFYPGNDFNRKDTRKAISYEISEDE